MADVPTDNFDSPVFDLRHGAPATQQEGDIVQLGRETIQIAPHPTTNRFPWKAVDNPSVPVYGVIPPAPLQPVAVAEFQAAPAIELPRPPVPAAPPVPISTPVVPVTPITQLVPPPAAPELPVMPVQPPEAAVLPAPALEPQPVAEPPRSAPPASEQLPALPIVAKEPEPAEPRAELEPAAPPAVKAADPVPFPENHARRPVRVYSDYTREVWQVLRPGRTLLLLLIMIGSALIGGLIILTLVGGSPARIFDLPLLRGLINR